MKIIYKKATMDEIELLTKSRIEVLKAANKLVFQPPGLRCERRKHWYIGCSQRRFAA